MELNPWGQPPAAECNTRWPGPPVQSRTGHVAPPRSSQTYAKRPSSSTSHHSVGPWTGASYDQAGGKGRYNVGVDCGGLQVLGETVSMDTSD